MARSHLYPVWPSSTQVFGQLEVNLTSGPGLSPISGATIQISHAGNTEEIIEEFQTDENGKSPIIELPAPPKEYGNEPGGPQPYSTYQISIAASGFRPVMISGVQLYPGILSLQNVGLEPTGMEIQHYTIPHNTLFSGYPPKIAEPEIKTIDETGGIVLPQVAIPEYIIVHDGAPSDHSAPNYYVSYIEYIKNVASSELYATWPENTISAHILAIISFTLNRVYTEWYYNKGYCFTVTSSTAFDHKWVYGRTILENISRLVDSSFHKYLSRPGISQPLLIQYCDGKRSSCPNWMGQWESLELGMEGYTAIEIIQHFYGDDMYINAEGQITGIPSSWPGLDLATGHTGKKVLHLQQELNTIGRTYPAILDIQEDGIYGEQTFAAIRSFQQQFNLLPSGITDFATWHRISAIYTAINREGRPGEGFRP